VEEVGEHVVVFVAGDPVRGLCPVRGVVTTASEKLINLHGSAKMNRRRGCGRGKAADRDALLAEIEIKLDRRALAVGDDRGTAKTSRKALAGSQGSRVSEEPLDHIS
jgi:hypothetical protein